MNFLYFIARYSSADEFFLLRIHDQTLGSDKKFSKESLTQLIFKKKFVLNTYKFFL